MNKLIRCHWLKKDKMNKIKVNKITDNIVSIVYKARTMESGTEAYSQRDAYQELRYSQRDAYQELCYINFILLLSHDVFS